MHNWVQAKTSRDFVLQFIADRAPKISQTELSRRCGFASRSTLSQLLSGKRNFQFSSASKLATALELNEIQSQLFWNLLELDVPGIKGVARKSVEIEKELKSLRQILSKDTRQRKHLKTLPPSIRNLLIRPNFPIVYAATGDGKVPVTLSEIARRTGLKSDVLKEELDLLIEADLVTWNPVEKCFFAKEFHLDITQQGFSQFVQQQFFNIQKRAQVAAHKNFSSDENLFYTGLMLIKKENAAEFKAQLRALMLKFVDQNYDGTGDQVQAISLAFFNT